MNAVFNREKLFFHRTVILLTMTITERKKKNKKERKKREKKERKTDRYSVMRRKARKCIG